MHAEGTRRVRVLVADDHPLYRAGVVDTVKRRPELELVGEAGDGREALERIRELAPDVAVIDIRMPGLDGFGLLQAVSREDIATRILFLSALNDSESVYEALGGGVAGFLSKDAGAREICEAVSAIARGEVVLSPDTQAALAEAVRGRAREPGLLSERELEVLGLTAQGLSAREIGHSLHLGATTVKTHLQHVYEKLGVSDRAAAVAEGMRRGLLQ